MIRFLLDQGNPIPSPALLGKIGRAYVAAIDRFALDGDIPVVRFRKGDSKEQVARRDHPFGTLRASDRAP